MNAIKKGTRIKVYLNRTFVERQYFKTLTLSKKSTIKEINKSLDVFFRENKPIGFINYYLVIEN